MVSEPCQCHEARAWRAYWTPAAIGERLQHELDFYRQQCHDRWSQVINDVRGVARMTNAPARTGESFATLEARRAVPGEFPPRKV